MRTELLWFISGIVTCLAAGAGTWIVYLIAKVRRQKKQIFGLMHDKGALSMRVSCLEDALKELEKN